MVLHKKFSEDLKITKLRKIKNLKFILDNTNFFTFLKINYLQQKLSVFKLENQIGSNYMKILSIYPYLTISSSALIVNGKVVSASTEERFNREKIVLHSP